MDSTPQSPHTPSPNKLLQLNILKTIAHKSWQEHHPAFLSISPFSSRAVGPQQALGEQSQGWVGRGAPLQPPAGEVNAHQLLPAGCPRAGCSPGFVNSFANEFMKILAQGLQLHPNGGRAPLCKVSSA